MEKYLTIPVGNNTVLGITQVFPTPKGTWKVMQQGKCTQIGKQVAPSVIEGVFSHSIGPNPLRTRVADAFDMEGCVKITLAPEGGYELFGTGKLVKFV